MAIDANGHPFEVVYGENIGDVKISNSFLDLANYIAYYNHRCYAKLLVKYDNGAWKSASYACQKKFNEELNSEFFFHEMK